MAATPELMPFPLVNLSDVAISNCDTANVCTLTATATNSDVDTTAVTFTTKVKYSNGKFRLFGDQQGA
jgi:hypothetical protein